ncbi:hypothetical protein G6F71_009428 [Rhizopus microsporus]|nr:hypothetical protein G6F71_009428 [Rhizopus microsporus]KAG1203272.1 hypothetical protein G6F69_009584 [Rhizopus microsporus]
MPRVLPEDTQNNIKSALMNNRTPEDIASELDIHPRTVRRYRKKLFGPKTPKTRTREVVQDYVFASRPRSPSPCL